MLWRGLVPLFLVLVIDPSLCAQDQPLCIIQTKPNPAIHFDPSAGPWAIDLYNRLSGEKLRNGLPLKITVFPASNQKDILPEVQRLQCAQVIQLWYHRVNAPIDESLFYSVWNAATQKLLGRGSIPLSYGSPSGKMPNLSAGAMLAEQTLKLLDRIH